MKKLIKSWSTERKKNGMYIYSMKKITEGTHAVKKICAAGLLHKGN